MQKKIGSLSDPLTGNSTDPVKYWETPEQSTYYATNADIIQDVENLIYLKMLQRLTMYWYAMVFLLRWFRGFRGQAKMAQITSTLSSAIADLLHFAIIAGVLFVNFALAGHVLFGSEVSEFATITKALQSSLAMAFGRVDYAPLYEIAPLSSAIWMAGYVLSLVMICLNMLLAIIMDHYGGVFHANNGGSKGFDLFGQLKQIFSEFLWYLGYVGRMMYRLIATKLPSKITKSRAMPRFPVEESRIEIPYDNLYLQCDMDPVGYVTVKSLRDAGCDRATARHLYWKCFNEVTRHLDENYPLDLLFDEFDESMKQYYCAMDAFTSDLRGWFAEKAGNTERMVPRQTKLEKLSKQIEVAQHIEHHHHHHHSAETMEGEGHHHHHHSRHHDDHDFSRSVSQAASRNISRAPSVTF